MTRTYSQMLRRDKYSQHSSIIWPIRLNSWVFLYELSGCGFESSCSHLNFSGYVHFFQFRTQVLSLGKFGPKIETASLFWNLVPGLIQICRIQWRYSIFLLLIGITFLGRFGQNNQNCLMLSWECTNFLKQQKQPPEVFRKKGVLKNFVIFTRKPVALLVRT